MIESVLRQDWRSWVPAPHPPDVQVADSPGPTVPRPIQSLLGDLEAAVMEHVWHSGSSDVKTAHRLIGNQRRISLNTVQSTMERLYRKGLLTRDKVSHAYVYAARETREEFRSRVVHQVASALASGQADSMLSAFVDAAARVSDDSLERLERMVAAKRAELDGDKR